jgi:uncharacterized protein (TIGR03083 family)
VPGYVAGMIESTTTGDDQPEPDIRRGVPHADGDERAAAYADCRRRIRTLLAAITDSDEHVIVPACPDWTVRNCVAHLAGVCADLAAKRRPDGDVQAWVDAQVADRADVPVAALLDEWDEVGPVFEAAIAKSPVGLGGLLYDVVAHEHDLAAALGRPAERSGSGIDLSLDILAGIIAGDLAANDLPAVQFGDGVVEWIVGDGEPEFRLRADRFELMRFLGSRRSLAQMRTYDIDGDLDRFLPGLAHLPLPTVDLVDGPASPNSTT